MYPIIFKIGQFNLYTHGVMAVIGIIVGGILLYKLAKRRGYSTEFLFDNVIYSVLAGIIGARLTYFFLYRGQFSSIKEVFYLWDGGLVSYGGFILGGIIFALLIRVQKENIMKWLDIYSLSFVSGLFFGRVGNLMAGEYSGVATVSRFNINGLVPIPAYECASLILIFVTLVILLKKKIKVNGMIFFTMITMYGGFRFVIDIWRAESKLFSFISLGQSVSMVLLIIGAIFILLNILNAQKRSGR